MLYHYAVHNLSVGLNYGSLHEVYTRFSKKKFLLAEFDLLVSHILNPIEGSDQNETTQQATLDIYQNSSAFSEPMEDTPAGNEQPPETADQASTVLQPAELLVLDKLYITQTQSDGELVFICTRCSRKFKDKSNLMRHIRMHDGIRAHDCAYCGKKFTQKVHLQVHERSHTGEKPYQCPSCDKSFSSHKTLSKHKVVHTKIKPFKCEECGRAFAFKDKLQFHKIIHTGAMPYSCDVCKRRFRWPDSVKKHKCPGELKVKVEKPVPKARVKENITTSDTDKPRMIKTLTPGKDLSKSVTSMILANNNNTNIIASPPARKKMSFQVKPQKAVLGNEELKNVKKVLEEGNTKKDGTGQKLKNLTDTVNSVQYELTKPSIGTEQVYSDSEANLISVGTSSRPNQQGDNPEENVLSKNSSEITQNTKGQTGIVLSQQKVNHSREMTRESDNSAFKSEQILSRHTSKISTEVINTLNENNQNITDEENVTIIEVPIYEEMIDASTGDKTLLQVIQNQGSKTTSKDVSVPNFQLSGHESIQLDSIDSSNAMIFSYANQESIQALNSGDQMCENKATTCTNIDTSTLPLNQVEQMEIIDPDTPTTDGLTYGEEGVISLDGIPTGVPIQIVHSGAEPDGQSIFVLAPMSETN